MTSNGGPMIMPPSGEPVAERCLACERGRCAKCWHSWSDYTTGNHWICDCPHEASEPAGDPPPPAS